MRRRQRGVLLITVMFIVLLVGLFGSAMLTNGPAMARQANQASDEVQAQRAAETGAAYVRLQLRQDAEWKGNLDTTTVDLPDFKVIEDKGNVIGWIKDSNGSVSEFRIRFNYQDGDTAGSDELSDPTELSLDTTYLSVNNVASDDDKTVPDVNPSTFRVDDPTVGVNNAPAGCVFLRIEGLAGPGLSNTTGPTDPPSSGIVASRALRAIYGASVASDIPDSALSAGNGIDLEVAQGASVTASTGPAAQTVKFRSKKDLKVQDAGNGDQTLTFSDTVKGKLSTVDGVQALTVGDVTQASEAPGDDFHNIKWSEVPKASTNGSEAIQMPAGIYVGDYSGVYHYYDMDFATYKALPLDTTTGLRGTAANRTDLSPDFHEVRTDTLGTGITMIAPDADAGVYAHTLSISEDVNFSTTGSGVKDVVFTTPSGRELFEDDPGDYFAGNSSLYEFTAVKMANTKITSPGDLTVLVDVEGENASLTAEGDTTVAAPSVKLEVGDGDGVAIENLDQRLSVYTKGDLTVSTYLHTPPLNINAGSFSINIPEMKQYGTLNLQGLLYSWGDATIYGGTPGVPLSNNPFTGLPRYGEFNLAGALVAYGADPESGAPGSVDGTGKIAYHGLKASIDYDATKLVTDPSTLPEEGVPALLRKSYGFEN